MPSRSLCVGLIQHLHFFGSFARLTYTHCCCVIYLALSPFLIFFGTQLLRPPLNQPPERARGVHFPHVQADGGGRARDGRAGPPRERPPSLERRLLAGFLAAAGGHQQVAPEWGPDHDARLFFGDAPQVPHDLIPSATRAGEFVFRWAVGSSTCWPALLGRADITVLCT